MIPVLNYIYVSVILSAFLSSLIRFRLDLPFHLRLFSCLLGVTFVVELLAGILFRPHHISNTPLYNAFAGPEFWVYGFYYYQLIRVRLLRKIIFLFLIIFPIFWFVTVFFLFGFTIWNSYVLITGSFFSVLFAIMYYYQLIIAKDIQSLRNLPEFWIATGMLVFYLGALPYFGTLNFLLDYYKIHRGVSRSLLNVLKIVNTLMYGLFAYGFLCRIINTRKS
ncbi:MAG TPA: hypothetical protein VGM30_17535 [Puia sp.]